MLVRHPLLREADLAERRQRPLPVRGQLAHRDPAVGHLGPGRIDALLLQLLAASHVILRCPHRHLTGVRQPKACGGVSTARPAQTGRSPGRDASHGVFRIVAMMLADVLRSASDEQLAALLMARRDLATPPPADTEVLARRAATAGSVARACEQLNARQLAVAEALLLLGADTEPVAKTAVDDLLGVDAADDLAALERLALCWSADEGVSTLPAVREALGPFPAGLGRSLPALAGEDVAELLTGL